ncbi:MAG: PilT/PilU family type 4a pilus ATPase [Desulfobacterales bacterium]|nr:PilT/PilU family type 4a pilus ATPase [Desulfobacterales bacterium]
MEIIKIENDISNTVTACLEKSELFGSLNKKSIQGITSRAELIKFQHGETIIKEKDPSDSFFVVIKGLVSVLIQHKTTGETVEVGKLPQGTTIGEIGLLLNEPRTATIKAIEESLILKFDTKLFNYMFENLPAFGEAISKNLAKRVQKLSSNISLPDYGKDGQKPSAETLKLLPFDFLIRHRVLPLNLDGKILLIGFVHDPNSSVLNAVRNIIPGIELQMVHIDNSFFEEVIQNKSGITEFTDKGNEIQQKEKTIAVSPKLDAILNRLVAEGASDLHLSAGQIPHWRIDGEIKAISDSRALGDKEVLEMLEPVMDERSKKLFKETNDADFAYTIGDLGRFRVNIFRDEQGVSSVLRLIPSKLLSFEQLNLPNIARTFCEYPKGLILVTGPTGSGKSTTLAAMIDYVNKTRSDHIITMEDPIEFIHKTQKSLVNQRQIGSHTSSFHSALRSALREDPDIILVGELRDRETIELALEIANTGHLVFGTLHTSTAIGTISRIIDVFPTEQQNKIRTSLCESLKGVVAQALCKCIGGGRVAAFEILVVTPAVANLIREDKTAQILSSMQTGKAQGHKIMNEELAKLVQRKKISRDEAMSKSIDKTELLKKLEGNIVLHME